MGRVIHEGDYEVGWSRGRRKGRGRVRNYIYLQLQGLHIDTPPCSLPSKTCRERGRERCREKGVREWLSHDEILPKIHRFSQHEITAMYGQVLSNMVPSIRVLAAANRLNIREASDCKMSSSLLASRNWSFSSSISLERALRGGVRGRTRERERERESVMEENIGGNGL
jgi:hypothetical protein